MMSCSLNKLSAIIKKLISHSHPDQKVVFTLPGHSLPSQYRSLLPLPGMDRRLQLERKSRTIRHVVLAVTSALLSFVVVTLALIVALKLSSSWSESQNRQSTDISQVVAIGMTTSVNQESSMPSYLPTTSGQRLRCLDACVQLTNPRVSASCQRGFCRCGGRGYDSVTCLPTSPSCSIAVTRPSSRLNATYAGYSMTLYTCVNTNRTPDFTINTTRDVIDVPRKSTHQTDVHVISMFGNPRTKATEIVLRSRAPANVTVVLTSWRAVTWSLVLEATVSVKKIVLVTNRSVSRAKVSMTSLVEAAERNPTSDALSSYSLTSDRLTSDVLYHERRRKEPLKRQKDTQKNTDEQDSYINSDKKPTFKEQVLNTNSFINFSSPSVLKLISVTGYGDDRMIGDTPKLLRTIGSSVGPIRSFIGVAHADVISYVLPPSAL